jgi:hypothetical protein
MYNTHFYTVITRHSVMSCESSVGYLQAVEAANSHKSHSLHTSRVCVKLAILFHTGMDCCVEKIPSRSFYVNLTTHVKVQHSFTRQVHYSVKIPP